MSIQSETFFIASLLLLATISSLFLAVISNRLSRTMASKSFSIFMLAISIWSGGEFLELATRQIFWIKVQFIGINLFPIALLVFTNQFSNWRSQFEKKQILFISVIPILTLMAAWTNELHFLFWADITTLPDGSFPVAQSIPGPFFWLSILYAYVAIGVCISFLLVALLRFPGLYRKQALFILFSMVFGIGANFITYLTPWDPGVNLSPIGFSVTGLILGWGMFDKKFLDIMPPRLDKVIENLTDGIIVLDNHLRLLHYNKAAKTVMGLVEENLGNQIQKHLPEPKKLIQSYNGDPLPHIELEQNANANEETVFELHISPVENEREIMSGWILTLHDVTHRKRLEALQNKVNIQLEKQYQRQAALARLDPAINESKELDLIFEEIVESTIHLLPANLGAGIRISKIEDRQIFRTAAKNEFLADREQISCREMIDRLSDSEQSHIFWRTNDGTSKNAGIQIKNIEGLLAAPIKVNGEVIGVLCAFDEHPERYTRSDIEFLQSLANRGAIATQNLILFEAEKVQRRLAETLRGVAEALNSTLQLNEVIRLVLGELKEVVPYDHAAVFLLENGDLKIMSGEDDTTPLYPYESTHSDNQLMMKIIETGKPKVVHNYRSPDPDTYHVWLGVPLISRGKSTIGTLTLESHNPEAYSQEDIDLAITFGGQAAIALENARLFGEIQRMAITDELTGIANRRNLFERGRGEFKRAQRFGRPLSVLMFDIDDFKLINDTQGHAIGDQILIELADHCANKIRSFDIFGRYGGEEFVIILPEESLEEATQIAERLRTSISKTPFHTDRGVFFITVSLGVAENLADVENVETLIRIADQRMYQAKHSGKNAVAWMDMQVKQ